MPRAWLEVDWVVHGKFGSRTKCEAEQFATRKRHKVRFEEILRPGGLRRASGKATSVGRMVDRLLHGFEILKKKMKHLAVLSTKQNLEST